MLEPLAPHIMMHGRQLIAGTLGQATADFACILLDIQPAECPTIYVCLGSHLLLLSKPSLLIC